MTYTQPLLSVLFLFVFAAMAWQWRRKRQCQLSLQVLAFLGLFLVSWPPVAWFGMRVLEAPYPPQEFPRGETQAIVVLASEVYPASPPLPTPRLGPDTFERCLYAAWLYKNWHAVPVLATGGTSSSDKPAYALVMREALHLEGVPESMIWSEEQSHSTHQEAVYSAEILKSKGIHKIILVTDAYHMYRSQKSFLKQGLEVVPAACGYRAFGSKVYLHELLPDWEAIAWNEDALHESVGLVWYWLHGWI